MATYYSCLLWPARFTLTSKEDDRDATTERNPYVTRALASDWQLSGVWTGLTGAPYGTQKCHYGASDLDGDGSWIHLCQRWIESESDGVTGHCRAGPYHWRPRVRMQ